MICRFSIRSDCVVKLARVAPRLRNQRLAKWKNRASLFQREPIDQTRASVSTKRAITKSWSGIENSILQNLLGGGVKNKITDGRSEVKRALAFFLLFLLPLLSLYFIASRVRTRSHVFSHVHANVCFCVYLRNGPRRENGK